MLKARLGPDYAPYLREIQQAIASITNQLDRRRSCGSDGPLRSLERMLTLHAGAGGKISEADFVHLLEDFDIRLESSAIMLLVQRFDIDGDGFIDINEFVDGIHGDIGDASNMISAGGAAMNAVRSVKARAPKLDGF